MKIIIYGATEIGCLLATEFFEDCDITVIDKEENRTEEFDKLDISFIQGNATDIKILKRADIFNSDAFIACTSLDEANIVACLAAKQISGIKTICFVSKEEYRNAMEQDKATEYLGDFFIDNVIWPEELLTQELFRIVTVAHALDVGIADPVIIDRKMAAEAKQGIDEFLQCLKIRSGCGFHDLKGDPRRIYIISGDDADDPFRIMQLDTLDNGQVHAQCLDPHLLRDPAV